MTRRFWVGVVLSAPIVFLAMSDFIPGQAVQRRVSPHVLNWIQLVLATPVVLWGGSPFFQRGWASIVNRSLNMFTLIAISVGTADRRHGRWLHHRDPNRLRIGVFADGLTSDATITGVEAEHDLAVLPLIGWKIDPHFDPLHLLSNVLIFRGLILLSTSWKVL